MILSQNPGLEWKEEFTQITKSILNDNLFLGILCGARGQEIPPLG